jgi:hypothetical protein
MLAETIPLTTPPGNMMAVNVSEFELLFFQLDLMMFHIWRKLARLE